MPNPLQVTVYRGDESLRLSVPSRALTRPLPSRARAKWGGAGCTLIAGTRLPEMPWTSNGQRNTDPAPAMIVDLLLPSESEAPASPVLTTDDPRTTWTVTPPAELVIAPPQLAMTDESPQPHDPAPDAPEDARLVSEPVLMQ